MGILCKIKAFFGFTAYKRIEKVSRNLNLMSEADAYWTMVDGFPQFVGSIHMSFETYLAKLIRTQTGNEVRYRTLYESLKKNLTDLVVYRGERFEGRYNTVFHILGKDCRGKWVGLKGLAVET